MIGHSAQTKAVKHQTLTRLLRQEIHEGVFKAGDRFYSQNEIVQRFGVSKTTVLRALKGLVNEGCIKREQGRGTFVTHGMEGARKLRSIIVVGETTRLEDEGVAASASRHLLENATRQRMRAQYACASSDMGGHRVLVVPDVSGFDAIAIPSGSGGLPFLVRRQTTAPIVVIRPNYPELDRSFDTVNRDYVGGVRAVIAHFVERGYRRLGIVTGRSHDALNLYRVRGVFLAVLEFGMTVSPEWVRDGGFSSERAFEVAREMLTREDRPEAIFAFSDPMAAGVIRAAHVLGLSVPEDVAVAGFDDKEVARQLSPPLTTYRTDTAAMAKKAFELLEGRLTDPERPIENAIIPGEVIVRAST